MCILNVWGANKVYYGRCANGERNPVPFVSSRCHCGCEREGSNIKRDGKGPASSFATVVKNLKWHLEHDNFTSFISPITPMFEKQ